MRKSWTAALASVVAAALLVPLPASASGVFTEVVAFAAKTGYRGVVSWQATQPVMGTVHYGTSPTTLDLSARPLPGVPDTAQLAMFDGLTVGSTYYAQVSDGLTGERSEIVSFAATNAYTDPGDPYTIDLVVQLDSPHLRDGPGADAGLEDIARGIDIMAERTWDALDGFARVGKVIVTDTNLDYAANAPFINRAPCRATQGNLSDFLIQTSVPFDSHTWSGWAISDPCTFVSLGRLGWLVVPWANDLMFGYTSVHELMHYAFNAPDLYAVAGGNGGCVNHDWNGSVMHNSGGWASGQWRLTELDENQELTPCAMNGTTSSWHRLQSRYTRIPSRTAFLNDYSSQARGNPDGGELEIWILRRLPGGSTLTRWESDNGPGATPIPVRLPLPTPTPGP